MCFSLCSPLLSLPAVSDYPCLPILCSPVRRLKEDYCLVTLAFALGNAIQNYLASSNCLWVLLGPLPGDSFGQVEPLIVSIPEEFKAGPQPCQLQGQTPVGGWGGAVNNCCALFTLEKERGFFAEAGG